MARLLEENEASRRVRVLISAYACEPGTGSEPGVGWNWSLQAAKDHEVWVLTRTNNRAAIERELRRNPVVHLHFLYHDLPRWVRWWKRGIVGKQIYYVLWQATVIGAARRAHRQAKFDLVHHVTFSTIDMPGFLWMLPARFIWGPVGGGQLSPRELMALYGTRQPAEWFRTYRKRLARFNPLLRSALKRAAIVVAANRDTQKLLVAAGRRDVRLEPEIAVAMPSDPASDPTGGPRADERGTAKCRVLWAGGLLARKAPRLAIDAFALLRQRGVSVSLVLVGDGPLRGDVERRIRAQALQMTVEVRGAIPHTQMEAVYRDADVFLFTSIQDTHGTVVLEAMSQGLPVVALDHHGVGEIVTHESGIKVPVGPITDVVTAIADAVERLACDHDLRRRMGAAARRIAARYSWDHKREFLRQLYAEANATPSRP